MTISDEAVEAAAHVVRLAAWGHISPEDAARRILEASAPYMLDAGDDSIDRPMPPGYKLPEPIALPDLSDERVWAECVKRAKDCERESRRTRRRYWLNRLFGPDS